MPTDACIAFGCADIVAVTGLFQYWSVDLSTSLPRPQWCQRIYRLPDTSEAIWVSFCLVVFFCLNAFAVRLYGEVRSSSTIPCSFHILNLPFLLLSR